MKIVLSLVAFLAAATAFANSSVVSCDQARSLRAEAIQNLKILSKTAADVVMRAAQSEAAAPADDLRSSFGRIATASEYDLKQVQESDRVLASKRCK